MENVWVLAPVWVGLALERCAMRTVASWLFTKGC
jgi:hypothetical protein